MNAENIVAVSAAVVALVQLVKWAGLPDRWGPLIVIAFSGLGTFIWLGSSATWPPVRTDIWPLFTGWVTVTLTSAGTFGFTRASVSAVTRATPPPDSGAGSEPTIVGPAKPLYVVMHDGHVAFLTEEAPEIGASIEASNAQHVDGRPMDETEKVLCDSCGEALVRYHVQGHDWMAEDVTGGRG